MQYLSTTGSRQRKVGNYCRLQQLPGARDSAKQTSTTITMVPELQSVINAQQACNYMYCFRFHYTLATVPSRRYRRRWPYEYRQDLMYLSMVICIFIPFPLSVVLKCQRHFVVKFWLSESFRVGGGRNAERAECLTHFRGDFSCDC